MRGAEVERFEKNLANWLQLDPSDSQYHRYQGVLESQVVTLQNCGVITSQGAVKLLTRMSNAMKDKIANKPDPENIG